MLHKDAGLISHCRVIRTLPLTFRAAFCAAHPTEQLFAGGCSGIFVHAAACWFVWSFSRARRESAVTYNDLSALTQPHQYLVGMHTERHDSMVIEPLQNRGRKAFPTLHCL